MIGLAWLARVQHGACVRVPCCAMDLSLRHALCVHHLEGLQMLRLIPTIYTARGCTVFRPCVRITRNGKMIGSKASNVTFADAQAALDHAAIAAFDVAWAMRDQRVEMSRPVMPALPAQVANV